LTGRQFHLLKLLLDADGRVPTHRDLMDAIWGPAERGSIASLRRMIQGLRRKIESDPSQPVHILSQSRIGYRFTRSHHGR
jgi:two-component system, OmpR family, KDP operon response regulator KdpE